MKKIILMGVSQLLVGCGLIGAPMADIGYGDWAPESDISTSFNVATIRAGSRQLVTTHVVCRINQPAKTKKLTFDAGQIGVAVRCTDGYYGKSYYAYFDFEADPGHEYLIHMNIAPWNRSIELVDVTDDFAVIDRSVVQQ